MELKKEHEIEITNTAFGGQGIGAIDGKIIFVPNTLPGEKVTVQILRDKGDYFEGRLLRVKTPSAHRITPEPGFLLPVESLSRFDVPYSPGYTYFYADYAYEVALKHQQFKSQLSRILPPKSRALKPAVASPEALHYRNKMTLHFVEERGERALGYIGSDNVHVLDLPMCPLTCPPINETLAALRAKPGFLHSFKNKMNITFRWTAPDGVVYFRNQPAENATWLKEETPYGRFSVPQGSFFQVNPSAGSLLLAHTVKLLKTIKPETVLDLYCGVGVFGLSAMHEVSSIKHLTGADADPKGIACARFNAGQHGFAQAEFRAQSTDAFLKGQSEKPHRKKTCIILDPPRTGLSVGVNRMLAERPADNLIYVSCAPDTLTRDLMKLTRAGYKVVSSRVIDMFPRTAHFETLTHLTR